MEVTENDSNKKLHIVVAGGGTGGHLYPGVAVVEALETMVPNLKVSFVGTEHGIEARAIPALGYDFHALEVKPLKSGGIAGLFKGISHLPVSGHYANKLLTHLNPDFVLAVGGYAAGPFTALAGLRKFKCAFMEQNATLGLTNRLLSRVVDHAFLSFESTADELPKKLSYSVPGNPIRYALVERGNGFSYAAPSGDGPFHLLVIGGSGGARSLNLKMPKLIAKLPDHLRRRLVVTHQAGRNRLEEAEKAYKGLDCQYRVVPFIDDMAAAYAECHLLVCRAGMSTIAEVTVLGLPSVFVPFPSKDAHQTANAKQLVKADAGVMIPDAELETDAALETLVALMQDPQQLCDISQRCKTMGRPNAARQVAEAILGFITG